MSYVHDFWNQDGVLAPSSLIFTRTRFRWKTDILQGMNQVFSVNSRHFLIQHAHFMVTLITNCKLLEQIQHLLDLYNLVFIFTCSRMLAFSSSNLLGSRAVVSPLLWRLTCHYGSAKIGLWSASLYPSDFCTLHTLPLLGQLKGNIWVR